MVQCYIWSQPYASVLTPATPFAINIRNRMEKVINMKPNKFLIVAAALSAATCALHVFGGGPEFPDVIFAVEQIDIKQKALYAILWHMVTLLLALATIVYAVSSFKPNWIPAAHLMNAIYIGITGLFLVFGLSVLGNITTLPQWTLFLVMAAASWAGIFWKKPNRTPDFKPQYED